MPHLLSDIPDRHRMILSQATNIFLVIVLIYIIQYIFNSEFSCTCVIEVHPIVWIYIGVIPLILFFILKIVKQTRTKFCAVICCGVFPQVFQLLGIYLFWWGFILLNGDLYLCMVTKLNETLVEIPCKKNHTPHETSVMTKYKNNSQLLGYVIIAIGFLVWCVLLNKKVEINCDKCSQNSVEECCDPWQILSCKCQETYCKRKPFYERRYEELLSEETDKHLDEELQKIAEMRAKSMCSKHIDSIKLSQLSQQTNQTSVTVEDAWSIISQSDFYTSLLSEDLNSVA